MRWMQKKRARGLDAEIVGAVLSIVLSRVIKLMCNCTRIVGQPMNDMPSGPSVLGRFAAFARQRLCYTHADIGALPYNYDIGGRSCFSSLAGNCWTVPGCCRAVCLHNENKWALVLGK